MRFSTSSSDKVGPSNLKVSITEELIYKMRRSLEVKPTKDVLTEESSRKCFTNSVWSVLSVIANTAPESSAIQRTCDSEEEGYTGTDAAPAAHTAKSNNDHS